MSTIPKSEWRWFGHPGHFILAHECRFHLCTRVGDVLVSTVGEYLPDSSSWETYARLEGVTLEGRGDARRADFLRKVGYVEVGLGRKYETMVFRAGKPCEAEGCNCGLPTIDGDELDVEGYNDAGSATKGHYAMCDRWAATVATTTGGVLTKDASAALGPCDDKSCFETAVGIVSQSDLHLCAEHLVDYDAGGPGELHL